MQFIPASYGYLTKVSGKTKMPSLDLHCLSLSYIVLVVHLGINAWRESLELRDVFL